MKSIIVIILILSTSGIDDTKNETSIPDRVWGIMDVQNQGMLPHCSAYAICTALSPFVSPFNQSDFYNGMELKGITESGLDEAVDRGYIKGYTHLKTVEEVAAYIVITSPVILDTDWKEGMLVDYSNPFMKLTGETISRHDLACYGFVNNTFICRNSHGYNFGNCGDGYISYYDMMYILHHRIGRVIAPIP